MKKIITAALGAAAIAGSLLGAGAANADSYDRLADTVCETLDEHPNDSGVMLILTSMFQAGFDGAEAGTMTYTMVSDNCPRNLSVVTDWAENYS